LKEISVMSFLSSYLHLLVCLTTW